MNSTCFDFSNKTHYVEEKLGTHKCLYRKFIFLSDNLLKAADRIT